MGVNIQGEERVWVDVWAGLVSGCNYVCGGKECV